VLAAVEPPGIPEAVEQAAPVTEAEPAPAPGPTTGPVVVIRNSGSRIRIGGPIVVERGERVEDAVAVLGSVTVRGEVTGDAVAVGGSVHVEDGAAVGGEVVAIGGRIVVAPTARLSGRAEQVAIDFPAITRVGPEGPDVIFSVMPDWPRVVGALTGLSVFRLGSLLLLGLAAAMLFGGVVARAADHTAATPLEALVVGVGLQILLVPAAVLTGLALAVSVIGLPLVPVLVLALAGLWLIGFVGAVGAAGRGVLRLAGATEPSMLFSYLVGGVPFAALTIGSRLAWWSGGELGGWALAAGIAGLVIEAIFWSLGAGALVFCWLRRPSARPVATPPDPPAPPVPVQL
jgi:hypothetical protein